MNKQNEWSFTVPENDRNFLENVFFIYGFDLSIPSDPISLIKKIDILIERVCQDVVSFFSSETYILRFPNGIKSLYDRLVAMKWEYFLGLHYGLPGRVQMPSL